MIVGISMACFLLPVFIEMLPNYEGANRIASVACDKYVTGSVQERVLIVEKNGGRSGTRTQDLWLRRPALYPTELIARTFNFLKHASGYVPVLQRAGRHSYYEWR